ncbi:MAG: DUF262 domain-containing HNH endonuclease family protein [Geminocystis sp.]|nr:DUF262 domain-containing HNH endonuclease family protein [Geminocystis sp.]MCS7148682.1 DUF262 domain-containing HNH endonuclease family protein [Geminocystis sp.]MDW8115098.1 DUF262 domain-containing HNH endonuclease family protein [Geminocystis sp.]MDW8464364.1 DUF262 domain-containing HNH endonuclease family protein [Geminocystis sp.]
MQACEEKIRGFIEGKKQYIVPVFQRPYSWGKKQWQQLWDDVFECYLSGGKYPHFFGSIVTAAQKNQQEANNRLSKFILIDGQQRLITVQILLSAIRDRARELKRDSGLAQEIHEEYLINRHEANRSDDYYKIRPSRVDRSCFYTVVGGIKKFKKYSHIYKAYHFFRAKIGEHCLTEEELKELTSTLLVNFKIISISLGDQDNPYLIFESLNAKGQPLSQADLIRNYLLMEIPEEEAEIVYDKYWSKIEYEIRDELTDFLRLFLTKQGLQTKRNEFYFQVKSQVHKRKCQEEGVRLYIEEIYRFAEYYRKFITPNEEDDKEISRCLERIGKLRISSVYSLLLNCYDYRQKGLIGKEEFVKVCQLLENFLIRRFVCQIDTRELSDLFPSTCKQINTMVEENQLGGGVLLKLLIDKFSERKYPTDASFRESLYGRGIYKHNKKDTVMLILASIEEYINPEITIKFDNLRVEHIVPEKPDDWWRDYLGQNELDRVRVWINSLGNLTILEDNIGLKLSPFADRKKCITESKLQLNRYFKNITEWGDKELKERAEYLADICLEIWPDFRRKNNND